MTYLEYENKVITALEHIEYPCLVEGFDEHDIALSIEGTIRIFSHLQISPMLCAIAIWSLTMNMQVIPAVRDWTKHQRGN